MLTTVLGLVLAVTGTLVATGSPALAKGRHGPVSWGSTTPSCVYSGQTLRSIAVTPPKASMDKALFRRGGTSQYVGVSATLQGLTGTTWKKVVSRPRKGGYTQTVLVHPRKKGSVRHRGLLTFSGTALPAAYSSFRVSVTLRWYAYDGKHVRGSVTRTFGPCQRSRPDVVSVDAGASHACALMTDHSMRCWGSGWYGQLGQGSTASSTRPLTPAGLGAGVAAIAAGGGTSCAVLSSGPRCWGLNSQDQIGDGTTTNRSTPTAVKGITRANGVYLDAGATCASNATTTAGAAAPVMCWGLNTLGQVGTGARSTTGLAPTVVRNANYTMAMIASGSDQTCSVNTGGTLYCWGANNSGQMATTASSTTTYGASVMSGISAAMVASGLTHTCVVVTGGKVECIGGGKAGQLGNNTSANTTAWVVPTGLSSGVSALSAYGNSTCAVKAGGVWCWGGNPTGQLGTGTTVGSPVPVQVAGVSGATGVVVGNSAGYAWDGNGRVWAWGSNAYGQFGNGATATGPQRATAVTIH